MPTIRDLTTFVGASLGVDAALALEFAADLRRGGHIGEEQAEATPADAARLVTAMMATDFPTNAAYAVERFAALPLRYGMRELGPGRRERIGVESLPIGPGVGLDRGCLFIDALAHMIELAMRGEPAPGALPRRMTVRRALGSPAASFDVDVVRPGSASLRCEAVYAMASEVGGLHGLRITAELPGAALQDLGDLLAGRRSARVPDGQRDRAVAVAP